MDSTAYFSKFMILLQALRVGKTKVHFLCKHPGVKLPPHLMDGDIVRLDLSTKFKNVDLKLFADEDIEATLSFSGTPFRCTIPWDAIVSIEPHGAQTPTINFPVTEEQVAQMGGPAGASAVEAPIPEKKSRPSFLRVVQDEEIAQAP